MRRTSVVCFIALTGIFLSAPASPLRSQQSSDMKPAYIRVFVPADAKLIFDGVKTESTGALRRFESPPLPQGQVFKYDLKATWNAQGKDVVQEKELKVQAGLEIIVDLRPQEQKEIKKDEKTAATEDRKPDVIYWPTPQEVVDKMLEMAEVKKGDVVYDLGCGDGRIVVTAAKKYKVKALGFDIDPDRIKDSLENVKKNKVEDLVTIKKEDIFKLDLRDASVVALYLLPDLNVKLMPQLAKLKPGSRIVSHDFDMKGAKPKEVVKMKAKNHNGDEGEHTIYLWTVPWEKE